MRLFFVLVLAVVLTGFVSGLGVTPGRVTIDFSPNLKKSFEVEVIASPGTELSVSATGELGKYITLSSQVLKFREGESSKKFSYEINLPANLNSGNHEGNIIFLKKAEEERDGTIQATLAVATQIRVFVPYSGKEISSGLYVNQLEDGRKVQFIVQVSSIGKYDVASVRANIDVFNRLGEKVASINTGEVSLQDKKSRELTAVWEPKVPVGKYLAVATVIYDGETKRLEKEFSVGEHVLELQEVRADNFRLGEIVKFEMLVENKWNQKIDDVHLETKVFDDNREVLSHFKSSEESIGPLSKKVFTSFWDTAGFKVGRYKTEVEIDYGGNNSVRKDLEFDVRENELRVIGLGYVISESEKESNRIVFVLVVGIILLVLINLAWFLWIRKKLKAKAEK
ncbi:hypothetical protein D6829_00595 [Candidatus Pacearchaeota archaeon]|nr:MAG: hypothetical protein D6829_00595 [Candidatus Pacearchaeota archaeon]